MKKIILISFLVLLTLAAKLETKGHYIENFITLEGTTLTFEQELEPLLGAIIQVETRGENISGDNGAAAGILQIHKIQVDEVNRILKLENKPERFTYKDRWNQKKSKEMFFITTKYWNEEDNYEFENVARCWNGGPTGDQKKATLNYWKKVQIELLANK